jgi:hypothetical protein
MRKFLFYELKRTKRFIEIMGLFSLLFAIMLTFLSRKTAINMVGKDYSLLISFILVSLIILLINLIYFINRYRADIFNKSSYFTFTINLSSGKILFAKFLAALIVSFLSIMFFTLIFLLLGRNIEMKNLVKTFMPQIFPVLLLYFALSYQLLALGVSLSKVKIFSKYYEFVSLVVAIMIFTILTFILRNIYHLFPLMINFKDFSIREANPINGVDILMLYFGLDNSILGINLRMLLLTVFVIIFVFFANIFVIEEKIDL